MHRQRILGRACGFAAHEMNFRFSFLDAPNAQRARVQGGPEGVYERPTD